MNTQTEAYGFKKEFDYEGTHYSMHVISFLIANDEDKKKYRLEDGQFLVHLFDGSSSHSFSVFYNDKLEWDANVSEAVINDRFLIERIGFSIDDYYA